MEEARNLALTKKLITLIRDGDTEEVKEVLDGIDDAEIALVSKFKFAFCRWHISLINSLD